MPHPGRVFCDQGRSFDFHKLEVHNYCFGEADCVFCAVVCGDFLGWADGAFTVVVFAGAFFADAAVLVVFCFGLILLPDCFAETVFTGVLLACDCLVGFTFALPFLSASL